MIRQAVNTPTPSTPERPKAIKKQEARQFRGTETRTAGPDQRTSNVSVAQLDS